MKTRHPIRSIVHCCICGSRRRLDAGRVTKLERSTRYVKDAHSTVLVMEGEYVCHAHMTVDEWAAHQARRGA